MTSNKRKGTKFEEEFAQILYENGFWVRLDKGYSQTCDIIAGKHNFIYLFECKTCKSDYFNTDRVESNQEHSRKLFKHCGNNNAYFVFKLDDGRIYLSRSAIKKPSSGICLDRWLAYVN